MKFLNEDLHRFIKFGLVGVLNTSINWIVFIILNMLGMYYIFSNIIAYSLSTLIVTFGIQSGYLNTVEMMLKKLQLNSLF